MASILIVEDRPIDRKLLATVLTSAGHRVFEATDGADALRSLSRDRPDLVISDILMPTMDGYELVRQIRDNPDVSGVPVIFYSATYHEREAKALARQCGVAAILTKPSSPATILTVVRSVLEAGIAPPAVPVDRERFDREHLQVVSSTLAARNRQLEAGQQRMAAVVAIAQEVIGQRTSSGRLTRVCAASREVTFARYALLGLLDGSGTTTADLFASGFDAAASRICGRRRFAEHPLKRSWSGRTVRLVLPQGPDNPFPVLPGRSANTSLLAVPLATSTRVYGWLALLTKLGADRFAEEDEAVAGTLAAYAAIAYENSQLYDAAQRHTTTLRDAKERTDFALAAARMGIWEVDLSGGRVTWSDSLAPLFGLTPEQAPTTHGDFFASFMPTIAGRSKTRSRKRASNGPSCRSNFARSGPTAARTGSPAAHASCSIRTGAGESARHRHRHRTPEVARGAVPAGAEDGSGRAARRRRRARLQQPADGHPRLRRLLHGAAALRSNRRGDDLDGDPPGGRARRRAHPPAARVQPEAGAAADASSTSNALVARHGAACCAG